MSGIEEILLQALRQYRHNDNDEFVYGYDKPAIDKYLSAGWRCCQDHLLKPEHPCPICAFEQFAKPRWIPIADAGDFEGLCWVMHTFSNRGGVKTAYRKWGPYNQELLFYHHRNAQDYFSPKNISHFMPVPTPDPPA